MRFTLELTTISLHDYQELLKQQNLLPSRRVLLDDLGEKCKRLEALGIGTIAQLLSALSSPAKIAKTAEKSGVTADYLKILRREAGTLKPKRVPLKDFPDVESALIESLCKTKHQDRQRIYTKRAGRRRRAILPLRPVADQRRGSQRRQNAL